MSFFAYIRSALGIIRIADKVRLHLPEFSSRAKQAKDVEEIWNELREFCRHCGFSEVSWRTAYLEINFVFPKAYGRLSRELYKLLELVAGAPWETFRNMRERR